jgi:pimeloyl-ACP methyl ester carboxylesterase
MNHHPTRRRLAGTPQPQHTWIGSQGNRLCGDSWGDPSAPPVFLLHGGGQTRHAWRHTAQYLGRAGWYAVALDARGHGDSEWVADGDYAEDHMARDLAAVVHSIGGRRPALVGASMGGMTSLVALGQGLVDAAALVLADVVHTTAPAGFERIRGFMADHAQGFASLEEAAQAVARYRETPSRGSPQGLGKNLRLGADGRLYWHWDPRFLSGRQSLDLPRRSVRLADCVRRLSLPTLLVRGAQSDVVTEEGVQAFRALCAHAEFVDIAGVGHMLTGDDNNVFGEVAAEFLARHLG